MSEREAWSRGFDQGWYAALEQKGETIPNPYPEEEFEYGLRPTNEEGYVTRSRFTSPEAARAWADVSIGQHLHKGPDPYWTVVRRPKSQPWEDVK